MTPRTPEERLREALEAMERYQSCIGAGCWPPMQRDDLGNWLDRRAVLDLLAASTVRSEPRSMCSHTWETDSDICPICGADWSAYLNRTPASTVRSPLPREPHELTDYQRGYVDGFAAPARSGPLPDALNVDWLTDAIIAAQLDFSEPRTTGWFPRAVAREYARLSGTGGPGDYPERTETPRETAAREKRDAAK